MADPTNTITVINKDTGATIGTYSTMTEAMAVTTAGGNFEWVFDGEIAQGTGTQFRTAAKDLVISGSGKVTTNVTFWVGNASSNSTNLTVSDGAVAHFAVGEGGLNFRYEKWTQEIEGTSVTTKKASTLTIDNGRLYVTSREMPTNGLITVYGYGAEAQKDSDGNVLYGMKQTDGTFLANLDVPDNTVTVKDRFNEYKDNDNIAFVLKDYAWTNAGNINLSTDDDGNKSVAIVENSKITLGGSESKGQLSFSVAGAEMRISGDSEFYGGLKFNKIGSFSLKDESTAVLSTIDGATSGKIKVEEVDNKGVVKQVEKAYTLLGSGTISVEGLEASLAIKAIANTGDITFSLKSDDFASISNAGDSHTMLEFVNSHIFKTYTVEGVSAQLQGALVTDEATQTKDLQEYSGLDYVKVTIDGNAYTIGDTIAIDGQDYKISWEALGDDGVKNDLVAKNMTVDPYMLNSQNFVTDTTLSGTAKAYYRNPDENYSGFKSIYNVGSGATLTIAEGVAVDLQRDPGGTKSIILVGTNDYFASQGFEATGAGNLVVNGTLDVGQLNAMADGTITVNGELNITTACIEKGSLIYNSGSTGLISCLNIFNDANATVTVNGLAAITLDGEPAHALKDNGATDIASRFIINVTDADLAAMTGDTHTILNVRSSSVSIADKFTLNVNGAAYTLGEEFSDANGSKYVINFADAGGDSTANDLVIEVTLRKPNLSTSDVYVGNLTGKDGVAVHDTANKLTVFESDGTMSEGAVWGLGDWDMLDVADVNGDGADDILISYQHDNGVTGVAALINQQDGSYGMVHQDIRGWSNDLWEYLCSADVNGDGTEDILTIETDSIAAGRDKNVNAWIMDSTGQYSADMRICGKNTDWEIEGFGDVTGDRKADGILRFKKLVAFWEHDGEKDSVLKEVGQMSTSWKVIGSDDFTGDGLADILFGNSSAQYKLWTDIGEKSYTEINLGTMKNSSLELAGIGDFNGDGKADILWQAADGGLHWGEAESGKLNNLTTIA